MLSWLLKKCAVVNSVQGSNIARWQASIELPTSTACLHVSVFSWWGTFENSSKSLCFHWDNENFLLFLGKKHIKHSGLHMIRPEILTDSTIWKTVHVPCLLLENLCIYSTRDLSHSIICAETNFLKNLMNFGLQFAQKRVQLNAPKWDRSLRMCYEINPSFDSTHSLKSSMWYKAFFLLRWVWRELTLSGKYNTLKLCTWTVVFNILYMSGY